MALGVKWMLRVRTVIDAAQQQTFRQCAEEQILVRVRQSACENGVHLAVDGAFFEGLDVGHLHGRIQGGLLCKQSGIDDVDLVIGVVPAGHERKRRLTARQSYLDIDAVDQVFNLHEHVHVESAHHVDEPTPDDVRRACRSGGRRLDRTTNAASYPPGPRDQPSRGRPRRLGTHSPVRVATCWRDRGNRLPIRVSIIRSFHPSRERADVP